MADHNISAFFLSPRFRAFTSMISYFESDFVLISPTSVLDTKPPITPFSNTTNQFCCQEPPNPKFPKFQSPENPSTGLADLVNSAISDDLSTKITNKKVIFASKLRIQIPTSDFGTKTKNLKYPGQDHDGPCVQTEVLRRACMPKSEVELSELYTCVTSRSSNPKTTHIFENCVVLESPHCCFPDKGMTKKSCAGMANFLSFCFTCKKKLDHKQDIFIYGGEKAFCSNDCRYQEMLLDEIES